MKDSVCRVCGQNMTEGPPTGWNLGADVFIGQEVDGPLVRSRMKARGRRTYLPKRDPHQCISWNPDVFDINDKGWLPFHRSGEAEGWQIATPARGLIFVKGTLTHQPHDKIALGGFWTMNSWGKPHEYARKNIVEKTTLPVIRDWVNRMHDQDRSIILEADGNNIRWDGDLPGMVQIHRHGLDRLWISQHGVFHLKGRVHEGPKTGTGNDMQHASLNATLGY